SERVSRPQFSIGISFEAAVRDDCTFLSKAFDVLGFLCEITQRNEKGEICVAVSRGAKHGIELALHVFPNAVAPRANNHAAAYLRRFCQLGGANHLLIPFGKILVASWGDSGFGSAGIHCKWCFTETSYNCRATVSAANWDFMTWRTQNGQASFARPASILPGLRNNAGFGARDYPPHI